MTRTNKSEFTSPYQHYQGLLCHKDTNTEDHTLSMRGKAELKSRGPEALGRVLLPSECSRGLLLPDECYRFGCMLSVQIFKELILSELHFIGLTLSHVLQVREAEGRLL